MIYKRGNDNLAEPIIEFLGQLVVAWCARIIYNHCLKRYKICQNVHQAAQKQVGLLPSDFNKDHCMAWTRQCPTVRTQMEYWP